MTNVTNMDLLCMILKKSGTYYACVGYKNQQYKDTLIDAADETRNISYDVHKSEYMAETLKSIYQIDNPCNRDQQLVDFANLLLEEAE